MKKVRILIAVLLINVLGLHGQYYFNYLISFDDTSQLFRVNIDSNNMNNIWEIGAPNKTTISYPLSNNNVIITDTEITYPTNNTSSFTITHIATQPGGFQFGNYASIGGSYFVNSDTLTDFGSIEISFDCGNSWVNLITDTLYLNQGLYYLNTAKPNLSGNSQGWKTFDVSVGKFGLEFNIQPGDTILYRFSFTSDSVQTNKDGLAFDDLQFNDWTEGINLVSNDFESVVYPNPTSATSIIEFLNPNFDDHELTLYDSFGKLIYHIDQVNLNFFNVEMIDFKSGIYYYKILNNNSGKSTRGQIIYYGNEN